MEGEDGKKGNADCNLCEGTKRLLARLEVYLPRALMMQPTMGCMNARVTYPSSHFLPGLV